MIPFGSVGGCHSRVTEEAVTFIKVTFCGGSDGSESQGTNLDMRIMFSDNKFFMFFASESYALPASMVVKLI